MKAGVNRRCMPSNSAAAKLNGQMADFMNRLETFPYGFGVRGQLASHADDRRVCLRADPPDMQVCDRGIPGPLDPLANLLGDVFIRLIQQHAGREAYQAPGPPRDDDGAHDPHDRIQPDPHVMNETLNVCNGTILLMGHCPRHCASNCGA